MLPPVPKARGNATEAFAERVRDDRRRVSAAGGAPQPDGVVRDDRDLGRRQLTVYDKTQGVQNVQGYLCSMLGYARDRVRVLAPFVGGAFGLGLRPQYQVFLAALAAQDLEAIGPGVVDAPTDVRPRLSPRHLAARATRRRTRRKPGSNHSRRRRSDVAVRGLHRKDRSVVRHALPV